MGAHLDGDCFVAPLLAMTGAAAAAALAVVSPAWTALRARAARTAAPGMARRQAGSATMTVGLARIPATAGLGPGEGSIAYLPADGSALRARRASRRCSPAAASRCS
jgi:hypothetical protein